MATARELERGLRKDRGTCQIEALPRVLVSMDNETVDNAVLSSWVWRDKGGATSAFAIYAALKEKGFEAGVVNASLARLEDANLVAFCRMPQSGGMWVKF